jgi:hypothetical protein
MAYSKPLFTLPGAQQTGWLGMDWLLEVLLAD